MNIIISNSSEMPIYEQIARQIKSMVLSGTLEEGAPLPSIRVLAKNLRISVITTQRAYNDLERDGFIETVSGKGSFVAKRNVELMREERLRNAEEYLSKAVQTAKEGDISIEELYRILTILYEE